MWRRRQCPLSVICQLLYTQEHVHYTVPYTVGKLIRITSISRRLLEPPAAAVRLCPHSLRNVLRRIGPTKNTTELSFQRPQQWKGDQGGLDPPRFAPSCARSIHSRGRCVHCLVLV